MDQHRVFVSALSRLSYVHDAFPCISGRHTFSMIYRLLLRTVYTYVLTCVYYVVYSDLRYYMQDVLFTIPCKF